MRWIDKYEGALSLVSLSLVSLIAVIAFVFWLLVVIEDSREQERRACEARGGNLIVSRDGKWCVSNGAFR